MFDRAKLEDLKRDPPDLGMIKSDGCGPEVADGIFRPPFPEFWTGVGQRRHDSGESWVTGPFVDQLRLGID